MTTKSLSLVTAIVLLDVYLQSQLSSSDPLFLFASNNLFVNVGLLLVATAMVSLSFKSKFKYWWSYLSAAIASAVFIIGGALGALYSGSVLWFPQGLLPFDYLVLLEAGVVFGICALTYKHAPVPDSYRFKLPQPAVWFNRFAISVLKTPQSPQVSKGNRVLHA